MSREDFSCTQITRLLADKISPDFNYKEQLWFIARANDREAKEYLCLLLRTQFDFQPSQERESFFHDCLHDYGFYGHRPFRMIAAPSYAQKIARRALILRDARQRLQNDPRPFPFFQLPFEIRLQVYKYAFANIQTVKVDRRMRFERRQDWDCYYLASDMVVRAGKNDYGTDIDTALLLTNRQIFDEAEPILYQTRFIKIGVYLDKGLGFLESLSPRARQNIRAVHIVLPYKCICGLGIDHNLYYWCKLCAYMSQNLQLHVLSLNVSLRAIPANFTEEAWVKDLIKLHQLKSLVQCDFTFIGDPEAIAATDAGSDSDSEPDPQIVLYFRLQALLSYLRSNMCRFPASRLLKKEEIGRDWRESLGLWGTDDDEFQW